MDLKEIKLNESEVEQFSNMDEAIRHKSIVSISLQLQADAAKEQVKGMYEFRKQLIDKKLNDDGLDLSRVVNVNLVPDDNLAKIVVILRPVVETAPTE